MRVWEKEIKPAKDARIDFGVGLTLGFVNGANFHQAEEEVDKLETI